MDNNTAQRVAVTVGLPVTITYNPGATNPWTVVVDLADLADAVADASLGAADADADAFLAAWALEALAADPWAFGIVANGSKGQVTR